MREVWFVGHGVALEGLKLHCTSLAVDRRSADFPTDYVLPEMFYSPKLGILKIGKDMILAGAVRQYRLF